MTEIDNRIRGFIGENFLFGEDANRLGADESLVQQGIIDSTGVLELVTFLEADFQVKIADDELVPQNLDTIDNLVAFIERKMEEVTSYE